MFVKRITVDNFRLLKNFSIDLQEELPLLSVKILWVRLLFLSFLTSSSMVLLR